jgi:cysteine desulfurase
MPDSIYMDCAATTPVREEVRLALVEATERVYGNPSSIHTTGQEAKRVLEESREQIAEFIGARPGELIFTSGGTESDNLAVSGAVLANDDRGSHIVTGAIEHHAVLNCCRALEEEGYELTVVGAGADGLVDPDEVERAIRPDTVLVSIMTANNETGALQPVAEIGAIAKERGVLFHTDAVQALGKVAIDVDAMNADLVSLSAHKIYGPKGVGGLFVRKGTMLKPLAYGGHHERALRPGTENVPGIAAFAQAAQLAVSEMAASVPRVAALRDRLWEGISTSIPSATRNGSVYRCLPNILNVSFAAIDGEALLLNLDLLGIAVSTGSACTAGAAGPSHVLEAMGIEPRLAQSSVRFSLGRDNTAAEVERVLAVLPDIVKRLGDVSAIRL